MKRFRVLAALLMAAAAIGGSKVDAQAAPYYYQEEIDETSLATQRWARSAIHWAYADGLTVGGGTEAFSSFMPDNTITRAEAVTMMTKLKEIEIDDYRKDSAVFTDVNGAWYTPYVNAAYENGIVAGKGEGIFDPMGTLTRAEAVTMIVKALDYKPNSESNVPFEDIDGAWYTNFIKTAYDNGIVAGKTETVFDPNGKVTRAEFIMMLYKTKMAVNEEEMYCAVMIPDDAKGFQLVKDGEIKLSYDSKTKTVTGATKVKQCKDAWREGDPWQMVYFEPMKSFELIPTEDGEITLMRFFANGREVDFDGSRISKAVFEDGKKVICYRDEIGKMYPSVRFSMNPNCRAEADDGFNKFAVLTDKGTLVGGDYEGFRLMDVQLPMGGRILEHDTSSYVLHASLSNVCLSAGAHFDSGAQMLYSDPEEDIYFMCMDEPAGSGTCKLWIDGEDYKVEIADVNLRSKEASIYRGDYDQDGKIEYLLTTYYPESTEARDWYIIEVNRNKLTYVKKVDQKNRLLFGEGEPYIIAEQDKLIFSDGEKVYPLIAKNGSFQTGNGGETPFWGASAELQHKDFDGDGELEYAIAFECSWEDHPDPSTKKEVLLMIEIRDDKAELFECPEDEDDEAMKALYQRLNKDGYDMSVPGPLQFELSEEAILFYVVAIDNLAPERSKLFIGEVTYHEDGTFGLDEDGKGTYHDLPEELVVIYDAAE